MIIEEKVYELPSEDSHKLEIVGIGELKKVETSFGTKEKFAIKIRVMDEKDSKGGDLHTFLNVSPVLATKSQVSPRRNLRSLKPWRLLRLLRLLVT